MAVLKSRKGLSGKKTQKLEYQRSNKICLFKSRKKNYINEKLNSTYSVFRVNRSSSPKLTASRLEILSRWL